MIDSRKIREDFPIFKNHDRLVYLDSASSSLKPSCVIDREREYYEKYSVNVAHGLYDLSIRATESFEQSRDAVARWLGADREEIVFTRSATGSLNLLSHTLESSVREGDEIVVTALEHHANFLPWQALAEKRGARFLVAPVTQEGELDRDAFETLLSPTTRIVALPFVSNVVGTILPIANLSATIRARAPRTTIVIDATQAAPHLPIDMRRLDADFLAISAHKCFGPTGVGILWGKRALLEALPPYEYGGSMVESATAEHSVFKSSPARFEAGTPNIAGVIAFGAAVEYMERLSMDRIREHEQMLACHAMEKLRAKFPDARVLGSTDPARRAGVVSFALPDIHSHDIAETFAKNNICIRAGQHCAHPLHRALDIPGTARMSFSVYNHEDDIDRALEALEKARHVFSKKARTL